MKILAIVGQTASGKTDFSLDVAQLLGGGEKVEIISADAMQLYKGMDIGTAKISIDERRGIVHHQLDVLDVKEEASVAAYQKYARLDLESIIQRGKIPIIVGGSGLYVSALLDELNFPGTSPRIRREIEKELDEHGIGVLLEELRMKDEQAYRTIDPRNVRRIVRALEVIRLTGKPFTAEFPRHTSHYDGIYMLGIQRPMEELERNIYLRSQQMMDNGLLEETKDLIRLGLKEGKTASRATGYSQAIDVLEGRMTVEEAIESISLATRKLAKKQGTWFRRDKRIIWIEGTHLQETAQTLPFLFL
ncbi:MAG: tRNA (adenosine(37)-N6)-dimethylallyltransferase MiaA [Actinomycetaceae bacterium]|nr:tRNA (adenosine(37)-N6)-dimethylallyltransferase MiaA [Actinomycetaceae bacterium]